jgi:glucuronate isomerase
MTTDSRSLLSMSRHEYFRRVLCAYLGEQLDQGLLPRDEARLASLVRRLCHDNARAALNLDALPSSS